MLRGSGTEGASLNRVDLLFAIGRANVDNEIQLITRAYGKCRLAQRTRSIRVGLGGTR